MEIERRVLFERAAISGGFFGAYGWLDGTVAVTKLGPLENPTRGGGWIDV
jgi:hypothetical protein